MNWQKLSKAVKRISNLPHGGYSILFIWNKIRQKVLKLFKSTKVAYPSSIMLELTNFCNLHCTTCPREYDYGKAMDKGDMQVGQAIKIIDELWPYLESVGLTGLGETFLYRELEQVIDYVKSKNKGINIFISTNAMLPDFIENISKLAPKIDTLQVSIDGLNDVYEKIRPNTSFIKLDENLRLLTGICKKTGTTLLLNMVITKKNFFQMSLLIRYADNVGINYLDFTRLNLASLTDIEGTYYDFYKTDEFLRAVSESEQTANEHKGVKVTKINFLAETGFRKCPFPWSRFYICWNGFVAPCCAKPFPKEMNFGNVFDNKVINVLNSKSYRGFRRLWYGNITPDFCQRCHYIDPKAKN